MTDLSVDFGKGIKLKNPVLTASGTFGYGDEIEDLLDIDLFGGIVTKSLSAAPRAGNPPPRIVETPMGMLNSIGLANIGVDRFLEEKSPALQNYAGHLFVNIAGRTEDEYAAVLQRLNDFDWIAGFEINVSCPNVTRGGIEFGRDKKVLAQLVRHLRELTAKYLIIKLSPNVTDLRPLAVECQSCGADAISLINTVYGAAIDIQTRKPLINTVIGGLSGPAIRPIALARVLKVAPELDVPLIGIGGIEKGEDVIEFMLAGATAIQLGTVNFYNPTAVVDILAFLRNYCQTYSLNSLSEIIGKVER